MTQDEPAARYVAPLPQTQSGRLSQFWTAYRRNVPAVVGLTVLLAVVLVALLAGVFHPEGPLRMYPERNIWPFVQPSHPLGTDNLGRDIAAVMTYGTRVSLGVAMLAALAASAIGVLVGAVAGYYGGHWDDALMRCSELFQILPNLLLALVLGAILGPSLYTIVAAIALVSWPGTARLVRAEFLSLREREFVLACKGIGMPDWQIIAKQILPNALPPIIVLTSMQMAGAMLVESALAFLGLSDPNQPSLGWLIGKGRDVLRTDWYVALLPGLAIMLIIVSINLIADGLNDALNPRSRRRS